MVELRENVGENSEIVKPIRKIETIRAKRDIDQEEPNVLSITILIEDKVKMADKMSAARKVEVLLEPSEPVEPVEPREEMGMSADPSEYRP